MTKPKHILRKAPMTFSDEEALRSFGISVEVIEISGGKFTVWRPLEYIGNDFADNGDGTITDHATGLMWQKSGSGDWFQYDKAKAYIEDLNRDTFAGYDDWRMPTVDELRSLLTQEEHPDARHINPIFDKKQWHCWTSDPRASDEAWIIYFVCGDISWSNFYGCNYVRAVRTG